MKKRGFTTTLILLCFPVFASGQSRRNRGDNHLGNIDALSGLSGLKNEIIDKVIEMNNIIHANAGEREMEYFQVNVIVGCGDKSKDVVEIIGGSFNEDISCETAYDAGRLTLIGPGFDIDGEVLPGGSCYDEVKGACCANPCPC